MKQFLLGLAVSLIIIFSAVGGAIADRVFGIKPLDFISNNVGAVAGKKVVTTFEEKSSVIEVFDKASPSVVTVGVRATARVPGPINFDDLGMNVYAQEEEEIEKDIGTGFVVEKNLLVTNKHVVSQRGLEYIVIDHNNNEYKVINIYRDPQNDLAIIQIEGGDALPALTLGNSDDLKPGQFVIAIGTALGKFRHTVTTGVISGLGRGISASGSFAGFVEKLENVIQTDAAINPGNSGGPLLNSIGEVVGVNVAVADRAQNIGFSIPINVIKESLGNFNDTGKFERAYLGVSYQMISREVAILNELPQGAYVRGLVKDGPAVGSGIMVGDIITAIDGSKLGDEDSSLANIIDKKRPGDKVKLDIWREGKMISLEVLLAKQEF